MKLLGCFDSSKTEFEPRTNNDFVKRSYDVFETFFSTLDQKFLDIDSNESKSASPTELAHYKMNEKLVYICYIMRYLYDTAIDSFDK